MKIQERIPLRDFSTYRIGGPAKYFCEVINENDLREALAFAKERNLELLFFMGGGSNLIIADSGFDGLVIKLNVTSYKLPASAEASAGRQATSLQVEAGAGLSMEELVARTTQAGLAGLEWAGGLPGSLGGAIFGNAGCFGHEIKEIVSTVRAVKITNYQLLTTNSSNAECEFSYRSSKFKKEGDYLIMSAVMEFKKGDLQELIKIVQEKIDYRKNRHPLEYPNIGSIFKNISEPENVKKILEKFPELAHDVQEKWHGKIPTAVLIQKAGLAGKQQGGAQISEKHANFIINKQNAKATDVVALIKEIKQTIKEKFDIELEEEVRYMGFN